MMAQTAKTERLTVLLAPEEKRQIERRARGLDMSVGEFVRRASQSYDPDLDPETLAALIEEWRTNVAAMRETVAGALDYSAQCLAEARALREARHGAG